MGDTAFFVSAIVNGNLFATMSRRPFVCFTIAAIDSPAEAKVDETTAPAEVAMGVDMAVAGGKGNEASCK